MHNTVSVGIDLVEIARFYRWNSYSDKRLLRIFSTQEIAYCRQIPIKAAERFAVRFAAKEALYKALRAYHISMPLLHLMQHAEIMPTDHGPQLKVNWSALQVIDSYRTTLSLTHTATTAGAVVMLLQSSPSHRSCDIDSKIT